jgi:hypothetical protein
VLSEEKDSIDTRLGAIALGLLGLGLMAREIRVWGSLCGGFGGGDIGFGGGLLRLLSASALCSLVFPLSRLATAVGFSLGGCPFGTSLDGFVAEEAPDLDDDLRLCWGEDALDEALVEEEATEDREGLASRRERLSMALIASVLDALDRDMSDW